MNRIIRKTRIERAERALVERCRIAGRTSMLVEALGGHGFDEWTDTENDKAKRVFVHGDRYTTRGWILPDGTVLDFSAVSGQYVPHTSITRAFDARRRGDGMMGEYDIYEAAMRAGLIRFGISSLGVYVEFLKPPTEEQVDALYDVSELLPPGLDDNDMIHSYVQRAGRHVTFNRYADQVNNLVRKVAALSKEVA